MNYYLWMLFQKTGENDLKAFAELYEIYRPKILRIVKRIIKNDSEADDVVQDVLSNLWEKRALLSDIKNPDSWLFTCANNRALSYIRKEVQSNRLTNKVNDQRVADSLDDLVDSRDTQRRLQLARESLSPRQKEIYLMRREKGFTIAEIAALLGIAESTVQNHLTEALKKIRSFMT